MSVSTCVKCDSPDCEEQRCYDPMIRSHEWKLPDSWFTLVRGDTQLHDAWHFCSFSCLHEWVKREASRGSK